MHCQKKVFNINRPWDDPTVAMIRCGLQNRYYKYVQGLAETDVHNKWIGNFSKDMETVKKEVFSTEVKNQ